MEIIFFPTATELRKWFEQHHETAPELWVGYYKKGSQRASISWPESVDEALCFGWIDGIRKSVDQDSYKIRFTPRRIKSIWSAVNIRRVEFLIEQGLMQPAGLKAFEARQENRSGIYSYEQREAKLAEPYENILKQNEAAWALFQIQTATFKKNAGWWINSAKKEATRLKRLEKLIEDLSNQQTDPLLSGKK